MRRANGKTDHLDATELARAARGLTDQQLRRPRRAGDRTILRVLTTARDQMTGESTRAPPYKPGDRVAWIGEDASGVRVSRAEVLRVGQDLAGWSVETSLGREWVDERGEGNQVVPIDDELARDFEARGDSFTVHSTTHEITRTSIPTSTGDGSSTKTKGVSCEPPPSPRHRSALATPPPNGDEILTTAEVSALLKIPVQTLYKRNLEGNGPPFYKIGKHSRYKRSEVMAWFDAHLDEVSRGI